MHTMSAQFRPFAGQQMSKYCRSSFLNITRYVFACISAISSVQHFGTVSQEIRLLMEAEGRLQASVEYVTCFSQIMASRHLHTEPLSESMLPCC